MAFPTPVFRGRAQIEGTNNTMNVILHKTVRTMTVSREFDESINQDEHGNDVAWKAQNEKKMLDVDMYLMANSNTSLANVKANAVFLNIYTSVNITNSDVTEVNGVYQVISGDSISLEQAATGKMAVKLRRYADSDQNNIAITTPA